MAVIEQIVRPAVPPAIRPAAAPTPAQQTQADQDVVTITGSGGQFISLSHSASVNWDKRSEKLEPQYRIYDLVRVTNPCDSTIYIDVEVDTYRQWRDWDGKLYKVTLEHPKERPARCGGGNAAGDQSGVAILRRDIREDIPKSSRGNPFG